MQVGERFGFGVGDDGRGYEVLREGGVDFGRQEAVDARVGDDVQEGDAQGGGGRVGAGHAVGGRGTLVCCEFGGEVGRNGETKGAGGANIWARTSDSASRWERPWRTKDPSMSLRSFLSGLYLSLTTCWATL